MKGYGQFCPVAQASEIVGERWTPLVLRELLCGSRRFNDIRRGVPLMSPTLLSQRLKSLEQAGVIERRRSAGSRTIEYCLTAAGQELFPLIEMLGVWGKRWVKGRLGADADVGLLMWDMHRRIERGRLPEGRTVIQLEFEDAPEGKKRWWLVCSADEVDLCLTEPGFEVDLYIFTDVGTLTRVWLGDLALEEAVRTEAIELHGAREVCVRLKDWLQLSLFAPVARAA